MTVNSLDRAAIRFFLGICYESMPESTYKIFGHLLKRLYCELDPMHGQVSDMYTRPGAQCDYELKGE